MQRLRIKGRASEARFSAGDFQQHNEISMIEDFHRMDPLDPRPTGPYTIDATAAGGDVSFLLTAEGCKLCDFTAKILHFETLEEAKKVFDSFDQSLFDFFRPFPEIRISLWHQAAKDQGIEVSGLQLQERTFTQDPHRRK